MESFAPPIPGWIQVDFLAWVGGCWLATTRDATTPVVDDYSAQQPEMDENLPFEVKRCLLMENSVMSCHLIILISGLERKVSCPKNPRLDPPMEGFEPV